MIKVNKDFSIDKDFFELNPALALIDPFSDLKKLKQGSRYAWTCFFMLEPDTEINPIFKLPEATRKEQLIKNYFIEDMSWDNKVFQECLEKYFFLCMSPIERALKEEYDSLAKRAKLIRESEYTLDSTDENGKKIYGTATQLDKMRASTLKIYQQIEKALELFKKTKEEARVYGGRKETLAEQELI